MAEGLAGRIFEGWEVAGITTFSGGLPYDIFTATDTAHTGQQQRPDFDPAGTPALVSNPRTQTGPDLCPLVNPSLPHPPSATAPNLALHIHHTPAPPQHP